MAPSAALAHASGNVRRRRSWVGRGAARAEPLCKLQMPPSPCLERAMPCAAAKVCDRRCEFYAGVAGVCSAHRHCNNRVQLCWALPVHLLRLPAPVSGSANSTWFTEVIRLRMCPVVGQELGCQAPKAGKKQLGVQLYRPMSPDDLRAVWAVTQPSAIKL